MSNFEQWLRTSMDAAVADARPPDAVMDLVRRRHRQRGARLAASASAVAVLLVAAAVPLARAWHAGAVRPAGPVSGGILRIVAAYGPDHLDPVPAYYTADFILERAYARQLVTYRTVPDSSLTSAGWQTDITPVADLATELPSARNGGISAGGRVYTFHLRPGANWDTSPPRQVTAADFIREFKAFCNPAGSVGNIGYYTATIVGMARYCNAENSYFANPRKHPVTAANIAAFQNSHVISGLTVVNQLTLRFRLIRPAGDFLYLLALPFASARPVEYDQYLPNSLQLDRHLISDGPYSVSSYNPVKGIVLRRNPAWKQSTDPVRHQYAKEIIVTIGVTSAFTQISDLRRGRYDLMLDTSVPTSALPSLRRSPQFHVWPGANLYPYVVFNTRSPNSGHAVGHVDLRRAIEFGINKAAVQQIDGGPAVAKIIGSPEPPGNLGYLATNPYPSPGDRGNIARCKAELARAGYHNGVRLKFLYPATSDEAAEFAAIRASLRRCGIRLIGDRVPTSAFYTMIANVGQSSKPGAFDMALVGWLADWYGNDGRSIIDPLFRTNCVNFTNNYGCYSNRAVDRAVYRAEAAATPQQASRFWLAAVRQIMADAAIVPLIDNQNPIYASARAREAGLRSGVVFAPNTGGPDITNIWLANG